MSELRSRLTLIQAQVLEALCIACDDSTSRRARPAKVREALGTIRPSKVSEKYVRRVLADLEGQRVDGAPIVRREHVGRGAVAYRPLNTGVAYVNARSPRRQER